MSERPSLCPYRPRLTFHGRGITNQIHDDRCAECGMGLCHPAEWHPYEACERFKKMHDSTKVWDYLYSRIEKGQKPW